MSLFDKYRGKEPPGTAQESMTKEQAQAAYQRALSRKRWDTGLKELQRWIELDPENTNLPVRMAELLLKMEKKKEAIKIYWEAVQTHYQAGLYRQAKALNQMILKLAPRIRQAQKMALDIDAKLGFYKHPLFEALPEEEFGEIVRNTALLKVPKDTMVIREGDSGDCLYMICSGAVDVYIKNKGKGIADKVARLGKDNFFGEGGFLTGNPRTASVVASENTELLELAKKHLDRAVSKYPAVGEIIRKYHEKRDAKGKKR